MKLLQILLKQINLRRFSGPVKAFKSYQQ
jgi:hypothetical protein